VITPEKVGAAIGYIVAIAGDDEAAHCAEDSLRREVLEAIAAGSPHARELAEMALRTEGIDFSRWYA